MNLALLGVLMAMAAVSCQMFDKKPTIYDHMKSGANTVKTNLIESQLKVENLFMPDNCVLNDEDFYGDRKDEILLEKQRLRLLKAEYGDTVTVHFTISLDDGTVVDRSVQPSDDVHEEDTVRPAIFTMGYGRVIPGWELGINGMCLGEIRKITIPPQLAYGPKGYKEKNIPPDATIEIETELVELKKKDFVDHYMDFLRNLPVYAIFILGLTFLLGGYYRGQIGEKRRLYREIAERKRRQMEAEEEEEENNEEAGEEEKEEEEEEEEEGEAGEAEGDAKEVEKAEETVVVGNGIGRKDARRRTLITRL
ncbi:uncharacterized protein LOC127849169 [Dreissena polymorpha]|nr:uncharacterized protein LOC127849169 [Dreissena polymorpha]